MPKLLNYEIIIVNDGSHDKTKNYLSSYSKNRNFKIINQKNLGRSMSLFRGITLASKEYTIIMDDDDYFFKDSFINIYQILCSIRSNFYIFNTKITNNDLNLDYLDKKKINFVKLKSDFKIKKDLKEIVKTKLIKRAFIKYSKIISTNRRIPTGLIWSEISKKNESYFFSKQIIKKNYLLDGLTKKSNLYKFLNPAPMAEMYLNFTNNHNYTSFINKLKYNVLYYRYIYHCKKNINLFSHNIFLNLFGFLIYLFDRINLIIKKK